MKAGVISLMSCVHPNIRNTVNDHRDKPGGLQLGKPVTCGGLTAACSPDAQGAGGRMMLCAFRLNRFPAWGCLMTRTKMRRTTVQLKVFYQKFYGFASGAFIPQDKPVGVPAPFS